MPYLPPANRLRRCGSAPYTGTYIRAHYSLSADLRHVCPCPAGHVSRAIPRAIFRAKPEPRASKPRPAPPPPPPPSSPRPPRMDAWHSRLFRCALGALCGARGGAPPSATGAEHLVSAVPAAALALFAALSPKATRGALADIEECARSSPYARGASSAGGARPLLLRPVADVLVEARSGKGVVRVGGARAEGRREYTVVLRDVEWPAEEPVLVDGKDAALMDFNCNCKAFAFRAMAETMCKHVVIAAVAACAQLAPVTVVEEEQFLGSLREGE